MGEGPRGRKEKESLHKIFIRKKAVTPVVLVTIQQLDVDKLQMRIAIATLSWLLMQSQDGGPQIRTHTIQHVRLVCFP